MRIITLSFREIAFFKKNFVYSVAITALLTIASLSLIHTAIFFTENSKRKIDEKMLSTETMMVEMRQQYQSISEKMGYTFSLIPVEQDISEFYSNNFSGHYLPIDIYDSLQIFTCSGIRCMLPVIQFKTSWKNRDILIKGTGTFSAKNGSLSNCASSVPLPQKGTAWLGYELHQQNSIIRGNTLHVETKIFSVDSCMDQAGSIDDISLWMNIEDASSIVKKSGVLSEILIWIDIDSLVNIAGITSRILSKAHNCKVVERSNAITMQIKANAAALKNAQLAIQRETKLSEDENRIRVRLFVFAIIVSALLVFTWISIMIIQNMAVRQPEIFTLKAIGYSRILIFSIFATRTIYMAIAGIVSGALITWSGLAFLKVRYVMMPVVHPVDIAVFMFIFAGIGVSFIIAIAINRNSNNRVLSATEEHY